MSEDVRRVALQALLFVLSSPLVYAEPPAESTQPELANLESADEPGFWRWTLQMGLGGSVRFSVRDEWDQSRFAPVYFSLRPGVVFPATGRLSHEVSLSVQTNLSPDGNYASSRVAPGAQWVLAPAYNARLAWPEHGPADVVARARLGVPVVLSPDVTAGVELALSASVLFTAGLGVYLEVAESNFIGAFGRDGLPAIHSMLSIEMGLALDWEWLQ